VKRLIAEPEHNGKRARVLSFDARTGRYAAALDDGKELSLKAACVARAGCTAAGCASEEASSVCARCEYGTARTNASARTGRRTSQLVWHLRSLEVASEGRVVSAVPKLRLDRFVYLVYLQPSAGLTIYSGSCTLIYCSLY
jgi:hypothetical protein